MTLGRHDSLFNVISLEGSIVYYKCPLRFPPYAIEVYRSTYVIYIYTVYEPLLGGVCTNSRLQDSRLEDLKR